MFYAKVYFGGLTVANLDRTTVSSLWGAVKEYCRDEHYKIEKYEWEDNTLFVYCDYNGYRG